VLTPYRRVLSLPGALAFSASGLLARMPISMVSLGIVVLVASTTGSYGLAGTVAASYLVGNGAFALVQGRLTDRWGQHRLLPATVLLHAVALSAMMATVQAGARSPLPQVLAAVAGAALPQIGSSVRARWAAVVPDKSALQTAFALEAVVDEVVFITGPTIVTLLATWLHPAAGLGAAMAAGITGTLLLSAQRGTEPPTGGSARPDGTREPLGWRLLGPLVATSFALGMLFGGAEVATVAFTDQAGVPGAAGPLLGIWAVGSLVAGVVTGILPLRAGNAARLRLGCLALTVGLAPLPFVARLDVMALLLLVGGLAISPTLIATISWVEEGVPRGRLTEGIAAVSTGLNAGLVPGAAVTGIVVDAAGGSAGYWVVAASAAVAFVLAAVAPWWAPATPPVSEAGTSPTGSSG
jgi:MFS family permease